MTRPDHLLQPVKLSLEGGSGQFDESAHISIRVNGMKGVFPTAYPVKASLASTAPAESRDTGADRGYTAARFDISCRAGFFLSFFLMPAQIYGNKVRINNEGEESSRGKIKDNTPPKQRPEMHAYTPSQRRICILRWEPMY